MSNERRFILFVVLMFGWLMAFPYVMRFLGLMPPADLKKPVIGADANKADLGKGDVPKPIADTKSDTKKSGDDPKAKPAVAVAEKNKIPFVDDSKLVLGSDQDKTPKGYRLQVQLRQRGAGVDSLASSRYYREDEERSNRKEPLVLVGAKSKDIKRILADVPVSLSMNLTTPAALLDQAATEDPAMAMRASETEDFLDSVLWEVVVDDKGRTVHAESRVDETTHASIEGQSISFRNKSRDGAVITKTFRLWQDADGLELDLKFESPDQKRTIVYNLMGPHGIPIEGDWYTSTFRDLVIGQVNGTRVDVITEDASQVVKRMADNPIDNTTKPLRFAGIENQYFAVLMEPFPPETDQKSRIESRTVATVIHSDLESPVKSDITFRITSKPVVVEPGRPVVHQYRLFAGPKLDDTLGPYGAEGLLTYRKNQWIPFAPDLARYVITPTLHFMYDVTARVSGLFGGKSGNYGVAIIMLTMLVRALMFPLGRKQARAAQQMQELQPHLKELQEKYKDNKEKISSETLALYRQHGVNPLNGCLPALIQLPIFVGLWQALNTSFPLRQATFLWIGDLAAPDMLTRFPGDFEVPFLGRWLNILPFVTVSLILVQTKLFTPPATTPEAESQQKVMKVMMVFMGVMFYKVPAGLGIYFITSSAWAICERLMLPKVVPADTTGGINDSDGSGPRGRGDKGTGPRGSGSGKLSSLTDGSKIEKPKGKIAQFFDKVLDEARKDPTYRKLNDERDGKSREKEKDSKGGETRPPRPRRR